MSIKSAAFKTALLSGLLLTGVVMDPARATEEDASAQSEASDDAYYDDEGAIPYDEAFPEEEDSVDGFEGLIYESLDEEPGEPENIVLMIETSDNAFTQKIYFSHESAQLSEPAEMVIAELASAFETQEKPRVTVVASHSAVTELDQARIIAISDAFGAQGVPGAWVQVNRPVTLAAAY